MSGCGGKGEGRGRMGKPSSTLFPGPRFFLLDTLDSQVLDSLDSQTLPSEPPDIRNWLSGHVYESPELNTEDEFEPYGDCGVKIEEHKKEKEESGLVLDIGVASIGPLKCRNFVVNNKSTDEVSDSVDNIALSSEPIDLQNWFSSYAYESPALDTNDGFGFSICEKSEDDRDFCSAGTCCIGKDELEESRTGKKTDVDASQKVASTAFVKLNNSDKDYKDEHQHVCQTSHGVVGSRGLFSRENQPIEMISENNMRTMKGHEKGSTKDVEKAMKDDENGRHSAISPTVMSTSRRDSTEAESSEAKAQRNGNETSTPPESDLDSVAGGNGVRNPTDKSNAKENVVNSIPGDGFIATKRSKRGECEEKKLGIQPELMENRLRRSVPSSGQKAAAASPGRRKVLSETTNFQCGNQSEITGKWRCPQKSKPDVGPPMKQLRLERWVHRT